MLVLPSSGESWVEGTLRESKATRSWATAIQISRPEALGEATFSRNEEQ
jgi:hypothetical protein